MKEIEKYSTSTSTSTSDVDVNADIDVNVNVDDCANVKLSFLSGCKNQASTFIKTL